jgi:hypothetical protein
LVTGQWYGYLIPGWGTTKIKIPNDIFTFNGQVEGKALVKMIKKVIQLFITLCAGA